MFVHNRCLAHTGLPLSTFQWCQSMEADMNHSLTLTLLSKHGFGSSLKNHYLGQPYRFVHIRQVSTICFGERLSPVRSVTSGVSSFAQLFCFHVRDLLVPPIRFLGCLTVELKATGGKCHCRSMVCCTLALYCIIADQQFLGFPPTDVLKFEGISLELSKIKW